jgi:hypothetical protein
MASAVRRSGHGDAPEEHGHADETMARAYSGRGAGGSSQTPVGIGPQTVQTVPGGTLLRKSAGVDAGTNAACTSAATTINKESARKGRRFMDVTARNVRERNSLDYTHSRVLRRRH